MYSICCLVTSQNVTAPKLAARLWGSGAGLVTSQNVTAPKRDEEALDLAYGLVTSQNVTAPKQDLVFKNANDV